MDEKAVTLEGLKTAVAEVKKLVGSSGTGSGGMTSGMTQDEADERYLQLEGGTLSGPLFLEGNDTDFGKMAIIGADGSSLALGAAGVMLIGSEPNLAYEGASGFLISHPDILYGRYFAWMLTGVEPTQDIIATGGVSMSNHNISELAAPVKDDDAATKAYVDGAVASALAAYNSALVAGGKLTEAEGAALLRSLKEGS